VDFSAPTSIFVKNVHIGRRILGKIQKQTSHASLRKRDAFFPIFSGKLIPNQKPDFRI